MNCCNDFGTCEDGPGCPAHKSPQDRAAAIFWSSNNATLDRVMNYPLRPPVVNEFADVAEPVEPVSNRPWDWIDPPVWLKPAVLYMGAGGGIAAGLYRYFF